MMKEGRKNIKKVLILANDTTYTYNLRRELLLSLINRGYHVIIACEILKFKDELISMGCRLIQVSIERHGTNPLQDLLLCFRYISVIRREKPDVVLSYNIKPNCYGGAACRLMKIPYFPNITGLGTAVENPGKMQNLSIRLYRFGTYAAKTIFFQNTDNVEFFKSHKMLSNKSKIVLLPGSGVDINEFPPMPYPVAETIHFLYVSRILKEKGIDLYLNAAKYIHKKYPNTVFHICGSCDDKQYLEIIKHAEQDNYLYYHGEQKDIRPWLSTCACLVHPSYYPEGMSNVLLEAASSARPVITTDRSGCRETVEDGISGYIVPIRDQSALNIAMERFMAMDPAERQAMGLAGRAKMEREFDRAQVVALYLKELNSLG